MSKKLLGVIGNNIGYSLSPKIHSHWFEKYKIDACYKIWDWETSQFKNCRKFFIQNNVFGANITIPYKQEVLKFAAAQTEFVEKCQAANTLKVTGNGISCVNSDVLGMIDVITPYLPIENALIIGAGSAARSVCVALEEVGVKKPTYLCRSPEKVSGVGVPWSEVDDLPKNIDLVVNTVPQKVLIPQCIFGKTTASAKIMDLTYAPHITPFLDMAIQLGKTPIFGIDLLVAQARYSFQYWFDILPDVSPPLRDLLIKEAA